MRRWSRGCARATSRFQALGALRVNDAASGLQNERLMSDDMVVLARRDHPLAHQSGLKIADLRAAQWILPRSHAPARSLFESQFRRQSKLKPPMPTVETADLAVIRGFAVAHGHAGGAVAQQLYYECESGQLTVLDCRSCITRSVKLV